MPTRSAWPPVGVTQRVLNHKSLIQLVRESDDSADHLPHLARYLTVRSAGLIEAVRDDVADQHCQIVAPARPHSRVTSGLRHGLGVRPNQLIDFVRTFDVHWAEDLDSWLKENDSERFELLSNLVGARRKVAHGDGEQVRVAKALEWAENSIEVSQWLVVRFDPSGT